MGINWGQWKSEEGSDAQTEVFAQSLAAKCKEGQTKYAINGDRLVVVTKDGAGNIRTFDTKIHRFNYRFADNPSLTEEEEQVPIDFDFNEPDENYE